ncbi:MAG: cytochrome c oxidase accessory protein FixG [Sulfurimonas sp.]|jgi:cytochrome c oxidase accessory protein FixG|uniref:cytochrome c oxidase accessory protein CcoG n=1 Tax=Sulfurimonas sp. TaxID=2022749 RepID=UPI0039E35B0C
MSEKEQSYKIPMKWRIKRYYVYFIATVFILVLPWITVDGNHFFLLSFDKLKLHLAFIQFDMQELYLMPFLLMFMFLTVFGMTVMGGRVFCGWVCPQTAFRAIYRDLIETKILGMRRSIKNKQKEPDMSLTKNKVKKVVAVTIAFLSSYLAAANFLWFFVPPEDFFVYLADYENHWSLIGIMTGIALFLVYDVVFLKEDFCAYICPYSRIQSVLYDEHTVMSLYNTNRGGHIYDENHDKQHTKQKEIQVEEPHAECTACEACVVICPTHIDIRKGLQLECINCLECVDACTTVMGKLGKPSLVTWSSEYEVIDKKGKTEFFRGKILGYVGVLIILMIILAMMGSTKENMLLNINKEGRLYSTKAMPDGNIRVDNAYVFLLQNTQNERMDFYFDVIPPKGMEGKIVIAKPSKKFSAVPGIKKKKVVILRTTDVLVDDERKDTIIPITIKAYAIGHEENIVVYRDAVFVFPRADELKKAK